MHEVARKRLELRLALAHAAGIEGGERRAVIGEIAADGLETVFARIFVLHVLPGDLVRDAACRLRVVLATTAN
jgi:hypothetical protein